jgi:hypothetical protein
LGVALDGAPLDVVPVLHAPATPSATLSARHAVHPLIPKSGLSETNPLRSSLDIVAAS